MPLVLFQINFFACLIAGEFKPDKGEREPHTREEIRTAGKLTKDKVYVEELQLPEIMIPLARTKGILK